MLSETELGTAKRQISISRHILTIPCTIIEFADELLDMLPIKFTGLDANNLKSIENY
jgi:hypothetical protein